MKHLIAPVRSWYSFRRGVLPPSRLAEAAAERGFSGGLLADLDVMSGQLEFVGAAVDKGIAGAAGVQLEMGGEGIIFAAAEHGWSQLCRLVTSVHLPGRIDVRNAIRDSGSLLAIANSPIGAEKLIRELDFSGSVFTSVYPESISGISPEAAEDEAKARGLQPLAVWPSMFTDPDQAAIHRILRRGYLAIEKRRDLPREYADEHQTMPDAHMFAECFRNARLSLSNNRRLAEMLPSLPESGNTYRSRVTEEEELLWKIASAKLVELYDDSTAAARRMEKEIRAITGNGLAGYFLRFHEIIEYCREHGIAVSARGSAGGSIVAYLLGISIICPIQHDLSFARFFNVLRSSPPDIDLDIDSSRRDQVLNWFLEKKGRNAAAVSQTVTHRARSAFRVAASGLGISSSEIDTLSRMIRFRDNPAWNGTAAARALADSMHLRGIPSHLAPHPCGLVCTHEPVDGLVSLHSSAIGYDITHFDKDGVEEMGLLKMDLLGQRGLTTISITCSRLGRDPMEVFRRGGRIPGETRRLIDSGRTIGVVHIESPAMRGLLREMRINTMEDVARALALVRPGASAGGGRRDYLECLYSGRMLDRCLPELRPVLRENMGVMLYQEDVSRAARVLLGLDEASSDLLRRRLKKGQVGEEEIISLCRRKCMGPGRASEIWRLLSGYAGYGFCKAHAFTYGAVACGAASLKVARPALYMASLMAAGGGFYPSRVYLEEARRMGVAFRPPGVNTGQWLTHEENGVIVPGFHHLKGMGPAEYEKLKEARPYSYPAQVLGSGCGISLCRNMAAAGCFREIGYSPPEAMMQLEAGDGGFFPGKPDGSPSLSDYTKPVRIAMELGLMGLPLAANPLELITRPDDTMPLSRDLPSGEFNIWGRYVTGRRLRAGAGFMMLEDDVGVADVFLPYPLHGRAETILVREEATIIVRGRLERGNRIRGLSVEPGPLSISPLEPQPPERK